MGRVFSDRCIAGITANEGRGREYAESSPAVATALNRYIGYEEAAKVAKQALAEHKTIRQVVLERGYVEQGLIELGDLDLILDVLGMTRRS
jgi:fumarate hydratase class II